MDGSENVDRVMLPAITAGLLDEWTPITANQSRAKLLLLHSTSCPSVQLPHAPAAPFILTWLRYLPFGRKLYDGQSCVANGINCSARLQVGSCKW